MPRFPGFVMIAIAIACSALAGAQGDEKRTTLQSLFDGIKPSGATICFDPQRSARIPNPTFSTFGLVSREFPGLTAYVPEKIEQVLTKIPTEANFYDGLEESSKILYLVSTLSKSQMQTAADKGIGWGDLDREQQKVFTSLFLRDKWNWTKIEFGPDKQPKDQTEGTFSADEMRKFRVRIFKNVLYHFFLNDRGGMTQSDGYELPAYNEKFLVTRSSEDKEDRKDCFGVEFKSLVANMPKSSDLNFENQSQSLKCRIDGAASVAELVKVAGSALGIEVTADPRVGLRKLAVKGTLAPAVSVLRATALAFGSTYRKVGSAYHLTRDVQGIGTNRAQAALWFLEAEQRVRKQESTWKLSLGKSGLLARIPFDTRSPVKAGEKLEALLEASSSNSRIEVSPELINPSIRGLMERHDEMYRSQPVKKDKLSLSYSYGYQFIKPDGEPLSSYGAGHLTFPFELAARKPFRPEQQVPPPLKVIPENVSFSFRCKTVSEVESALHLAGLFGVKRVSLELFDLKIAQVAVEKAKGLGVKLDLVLRPFSPTWSPNIGQNLNILMQTGGDAARIEHSDWMNEFNRGFRVPLGLIPWMNELAPMKLVQQLVSLNGVDRVILIDPAIPGYTGSTWVGDGSDSLRFLNQFGYSTETRLEFLRLTGFDPIDIAPENARFRVDLRTKFYPDDKLRGETSTYDGTQYIVEMDDVRAKWQAFLKAKGIPRMNELMQALKSATIFGERLGEIPSKQPVKGLFKIQPGQPYPVAPSDRNAALSDRPDQGWYSIAPGQDTTEVRAMLGYWGQSAQTLPVILEFSKMDWQQIETWLRAVALPVH